MDDINPLNVIRLLQIDLDKFKNETPINCQEFLQKFVKGYRTEPISSNDYNAKILYYTFTSKLPLNYKKTIKIKQYSENNWNCQKKAYVIFKLGVDQ